MIRGTWQIDTGRPHLQTLAQTGTVAVCAVVDLEKTRPRTVIQVPSYQQPLQISTPVV